MRAFHTIAAVLVLLSLAYSSGAENDVNVACVERLSSDTSRDMNTIVKQCRDEKDQNSPNDEGPAEDAPSYEEDEFNAPEIALDGEEDPDGEVERSELDRPKNTPWGRRRSGSRRRSVWRRRSGRRRRSVWRRRSGQRRRSVWRRRSTTRRRSFWRRRWGRRRRCGQRFRTHIGGKFRPNGCSIPYGLPFPFKKAFTPACNSHDYCYHYKWKSRLGCDNVFLQNMHHICKCRAKRFLGTLTYLSCVKYAGVYYTAVRVKGGSHYG